MFGGGGGDSGGGSSLQGLSSIYGPWGANPRGRGGSSPKYDIPQTVGDPRVHVGQEREWTDRIARSKSQFIDRLKEMDAFRRKIDATRPPVGGGSGGPGPGTWVNPSPGWGDGGDGGVGDGGPPGGGTPAGDPGGNDGGPAGSTGGDTGAGAAGGGPGSTGEGFHTGGYIDDPRLSFLARRMRMTSRGQ